MGIGLAHVGEFAFVVMLEAFDVGGIGEAEYQQFVVIGVCSLIATPLLLERGIRLVRRHTDEQDDDVRQVKLAAEEQRAIVVGAGPIGRRVASLLETAGREVCVIDLSPVNLHPFAVAGIYTVAGDASQISTLRNAGFERTNLAVVAVPNDDQALQIVKLMRQQRPQCEVVVRCRYQVNQRRFLELGCQAVVSEETLAAEKLAAILYGVTDTVSVND
jgi:CPA2 family monovalent cation:H+ antiporter-2